MKGIHEVRLLAALKPPLQIINFKSKVIETYVFSPPLWKRGVRGDLIRQIPLNPPFPKGEVNAYIETTVKKLCFMNDLTIAHEANESYLHVLHGKK